MVDYFSNSNPGICDKNGEKNDLKNSINPSLKKQDQILSPEDVASDTLTRCCNLLKKNCSKNSDE